MVFGEAFAISKLSVVLEIAPANDNGFDRINRIHKMRINHKAEAHPMA